MNALRRLLHRAMAVINHFGRTRWGRRPVLLLTAMFMLMWLWKVLGPDLPYLVVLLGTSIGAIWLLRHRRDVVYSIVIVAVTVAAPMIVTIVMAGAHSANVPTAAAVLTGYILAAPLPTLTAWALRPAVISRPLNCLIGSLLLLVSATPIVVFGDHGYGTQLVVTAVTLSCGLIWVRHRRALGHRLKNLPLDAAGWTDLGARLLPGGGQIDRVLIRRGYAVAATLTTAKTISPGALNRTLTRSLGLAESAGIPPARVQPILLAPAATSGLGPHQVTSRGAAAAVLVLTPDQLAQVISRAPEQRLLRRRRSLLTAAALAQPEGRAA